MTKRRLLRGLMGLVLGLFGMAGALAVPAPPASAPAHGLEATDLDAWLDGYMPLALHSADIAGGVVVVVKDGRVLTARGYGWADIASHRPVDPDRTLFRVGSVSKLFTWTAVMQQVEAGKLDLDRDVNTYLDFRIPPYDGRPVTLRQIMTHTAGFELTGKDTITFAGQAIPLDVFLKRHVPKRIYAPGTTPAYSNWGAALAGYIVQRVSGTPFDAYVEQHIFAPIGMTGSTFRQPVPAPLALRLATGYPQATLPPQGFEMIGPAPAGALSASGTDMARFMIAHLGGGRGILSPQAAATMHDSPLDRVDPRSLVPPLDRAELGFLQADINGHHVIGHLGDTQNFHTLMELFVDDHVGLFASFNSAGRAGAGQVVRGQLFEGFADRYFPAAPEKARVDPTVARRHALQMAGLWQNSLHAETSFLALQMLAGQTRISVARDGTLSIPAIKDAGGAPQRWDEVAPYVWRARSGHERLAAQLMDGKVVRWSIDSLAPVQVFDRVPLALSAGWILPTLGLGLMILLLTFLYWPAAWLVRRRYGESIAVRGSALHAYRALRIMSLLDLAVLGGWVALIVAMFSNISLISARSDGWLRFLQLSGIVVFVGALGIAGWNAALTWRDGRCWARRLWSVAVVLAAMIILYVAEAFGLLVMSTQY